jgi:hypothetical protein
MLFLSGTLLFYTAIIVPVQICLWSYDDPCNAFTTLNFDVAVDTFFLVDAYRHLRQFLAPDVFLLENLNLSNPTLPEAPLHAIITVLPFCCFSLRPVFHLTRKELN